MSKTFPYSVKSTDGEDYVSDHKTRKAAEKRATRQNNLWNGKKTFKVFKD